MACLAQMVPGKQPLCGALQEFTVIMEESLHLAFIFQGQPILRHFRLSRRICPQNFQIGTPCLWFFHRLCLACCLGICWTDFGINTYDGQDTGMCILWRFGQSPSTIIRCRLVRYSVFSTIVRLIFSWSPLEHPLLYYRASK